ncbi:MAG: hypothetical protein IE925_11905 [Rhodobacterales bacterium]|nr:hypothetical protein [Rhodobacterales bacterium]
MTIPFLVHAVPIPLTQNEPEIRHAIGLLLSWRVSISGHVVFSEWLSHGVPARMYVWQGGGA